MTAGNNGTPDTGDDDPFGYLYRNEGGQAAPTADRPGVPRTSYHQVGRVGERRQAPQQGGAGYPPPQRQQPGYGQQQPGPGRQGPPQQQPYGAPERAPHAAPGGAAGGSRQRAGNRRGLMIGAIAVVLVVAAGIIVAVLTGDKGGAQAGGTPTSGASSRSSAGPADPNANLPQEFAASLTLSGGATTDNNHKGAQGPNGTFVDGMNTPGATASWSLNVAKAGAYTLWVRYANAQADPAKTTVLVNGKPMAWKINLKDYGTTGDWDEWFSSYVTVNLSKGANTIALTCGSGDVCHYNLDRVGLTVSPSAKPDGWS